MASNFDFLTWRSREGKVLEMYKILIKSKCRINAGNYSFSILAPFVEIFISFVLVFSYGFKTPTIAQMNEGLARFEALLQFFHVRARRAAPSECQEAWEV